MKIPAEPSVANVLVNAASSTAGGGITYLRNVLPRLAADGRHSFVVYVPAHLEAGMQAGLRGGSVSLRPAEGGGTLGRFIWQQSQLRRVLRRERFDALVSLGNFAVFFSPVPQILFSRNDLYFSPEFDSDLLRRRRLGMLIDNGLKRFVAKQSIRHADMNVAPSHAFAAKIRHVGRIRREFCVLPFGYDASALSNTALPDRQQVLLRRDPALKRILLVSHYNYFRNFETLFRALARVKSMIAERVQLVLTTEIREGANYGGYEATQASRLIDRLGIRDDIVMLGAVPYENVGALYDACDVFVFPSYAESFGHPMLESMARGLPVIAADLPVHREVCGEAARYFPPFDDGSLATICAEVLCDADLRGSMRLRGLQRSAQFSWDDHVTGLIELIDRTIAERDAKVRSHAKQERNPIANAIH